MEEKKIQSKTPCGMRDLDPGDLGIREAIFKVTEKYFKSYKGVKIETPVLELASTVSDMYGEEFTKLVYRISGSEDSILRYDLTLPLARYVANKGLVGIRAYRFGKVYRKDNPQIERGRYREFYQCDFDIVGEDPTGIVYEYEILSLLRDVLTELIGKNTFKIRINTRGIIRGIIRVSDIPDELLNTVCSTIDKLDKHDNEYIIKELGDKGVASDSIDYLMKLITELRKGIDTGLDKQNLIDTLTGVGIHGEEFDLITKLCDLLDFHGIVFDPLLARGLDYYTGLIYEVEYIDKKVMNSSIASGGRYDEMIGRLSSKGIIPAIGISLGIERLAVILDKTTDLREKENNPTSVYVASVGKNTLDARMKLVEELRGYGIVTEMRYSNNPKMKQQMDYVLQNDINVMIILGEKEITDDKVSIKFLDTKQQYTIDRKLFIEKCREASNTSITESLINP